MRFVGRLAIILLVAVGAALAHSMQWPITRDVADALQRRGGDGASQPAQPSPEVVEPEASTSGDAPEPGDSDPARAPDPDQGEQPEELPDYYISVERAYEYWEEGMAFIDARTDGERTDGTIEGSFHLETRDFISGTSAQVLGQIDLAFPVIIFCGGGECDASENVAQRLIGRGYAEVYIMHEGYGAWQAAGHPTEPVGGG